MRTERVAVIGAGIGGLVAALTLAARGLDVVVLERAATPGGKMREVLLGDARIDAGPTVFTMRWVFEEIFREAGASLDEHVSLRPAAVLARHAWDSGGRLDLHADIDRSAEAIGAFAGPAAAQGYLAFCERARRIWSTLERPFIRAPRPSMLSLITAAWPAGLAELWGVSPFATLWRALGDHFSDPRLRQLFGRYSTYCGASPFLAPATLMLIAHVEQQGVWLVEGGMQRVAEALAGLAAARGARLRYGAEVAEILVGGGRVSGLRLADGERLPVDAAILNADLAALAAGLFGAAPARAAPLRGERSLSAVTWAMLAEAEGFPLARHTVFFSAAYAAEFDRIFNQQRLPAHPTVYACAQDRDDAGARDGGGQAGGPERLLLLVNAPPIGDRRAFTPAEIEECERASFSLMRRCGLTLRPKATAMTTPAEFERLFPATGGALYGRALHGWQASFQRPGARTALPGLYLCGGSTHPGAGVPMAALSGRQAAESLRADLGSTGPSRRAAMPGGTSTG
ncbi:1-hydroxycarotenoid 3,4-desaturase CrtD [Roseicella sp. DB1501]|uniref:1-hydroxycarotenoid 3,4-desaturase CrtD n=1 Tax=Roseicella sp. DB1501 TaxID=2730925 RepID=UPI001490D7DC|nr:1-hydroxycarotenoid 3,4-desaturase CrtD [Roseicella sp. DB1501]NOG71928.1 phytoene desaturase [Roseicella sp. DB1501]